MAVGDDAQAAGFPIVPDTGEEGKVRLGAREINKTRDLVAQVKELIPEDLDAAQAATGISRGTTAPNNSDGKPNGSIYLMMVT